MQQGRSIGKYLIGLYRYPAEITLCQHHHQPVIALFYLIIALLLLFSPAIAVHHLQGKERVMVGLQLGLRELIGWQLTANSELEWIRGI